MGPTGITHTGRGSDRCPSTLLNLFLPGFTDPFEMLFQHLLSLCKILRICFVFQDLPTPLLPGSRSFFGASGFPALDVASIRLIARLRDLAYGTQRPGTTH
jgi:hypothetical protein